MECIRQILLPTATTIGDERLWHLRGCFAPVVLALDAFRAVNGGSVGAGIDVRVVAVVESGSGWGGGLYLFPSAPSSCVGGRTGEHILLLQFSQFAGEWSLHWLLGEAVVMTVCGRARCLLNFPRCRRFRRFFGQ